MAMAASVASVLSSSIVAAAPASSSSSCSARASTCAASLSSETLSIGLAVRKPLQGECFRSNVCRTGSLKFKPLPIRAASSEETTTDTSKQVEDLIADLKEKWDGVENKSTVLLYGGGAVLALWLSSTIVGAVNSVPLLPKILELVGLGYTGWFTYRYLLFKSSRKELVADIEELKKKITGATEE